MKIRQYSAPNVGDPAPKGTVDNPYTMDEFLNFSLGEFPGGYVEGLGYVSPDAVAMPGASDPDDDPDYFPSSWGYPYGSESSDSSSSGSDSSEPSHGSPEHYDTGNHDDMTPTNLWENSSFNIPAAVTHLTENAHNSPTYFCARYVRMAINAGGIATPNNPAYAYQYAGYLEGLGFRPVTTNELPGVFYAGDIIVIQPISGHPAGHIAMYNGKQWISDFKQQDIWGGAAYRWAANDGTLNYTIYRYHR